MNWHNEPWRKLYRNLDGEWLQLSVLARGIGSELIKYAKEDGTLCRTRGKDPATAVALLLSACPEEFDVVCKAVRELIDDRYLCVTNVTPDQAVKIRNFAPAQERLSPGAIRQKRFRDKHKARGTVTTVTDSNATESVTVQRNGNGETNRNESKRIRTEREGDSHADEAKPLECDLGKADGKAQRDRVDRWLEPSLAILEQLNAARKRAMPNARGIRASYAALDGICKRLEAGKTTAECLAVIEVCEAEVKRRPEAGQWFDQVSPWRAENFERKLASDRRTIPSVTKANTDAHESDALDSIFAPLPTVKHAG